MIKSILCIGLLFMPIFLFGQNKNEPLNTSDSIKEFYYSKTFNPHKYLNGREYKPYHNPSVTSPFLNSVLGFGTIYSDGITYKGLTIAYDLNLDELVVLPAENLSENLYVKINKSTVDSFTISYNNLSLTFHHLLFKNNESLDGFYEIPFKGKSILLTKHYALGSISEGVLVFDHKKDNFLIVDNQIYKLKKKKALVNLYDGHKDKIIKKIRSFRKPFKKLTNYQIAEVIQFAESL